MEEIIWGSDLAAALDTARKDNKVLFMAFSSPDCNTCMKMETGTFMEDNVKEYITHNMVPLKFTSKRNPEKYLRYKVTDTPTYVVMNTSGVILLHVSGYFTPDDIVKKFDEVLKQ